MRWLVLAAVVLGVVSWLLWHNIGYAIRRRREERDEHQDNAI